MSSHFTIQLVKPHLKESKEMWEVVQRDNKTSQRKTIDTVEGFTKACDRLRQLTNITYCDFKLFKQFANFLKQAKGNEMQANGYYYKAFGPQRDLGIMTRYTWREAKRWYDDQWFNINDMKEHYPT